MAATVMRFCHHCLKKISRHCNFFSSVACDGKLQISEEVASALHSGKPVVALETTIITHGMPYPENLRMAVEVEEVVRASGAIPAPVAVLQGRVHVGLSNSQLGFLADPSTSAIKTSRRDFPYVLSQHLNGGTTVSGTMVIAHQAGIQMFATGGIGGVHRGAETSMDISADLMELSRTPVTVVSAGVKSILDIGRTLEYLETMGVCVASYGDSRDFPAFFTRSSGYQSPYNVTTATQAASLIDSSRKLGLQTGCLIAVPVPPEFEAAGEKIETAIQSAVQETSNAGISGHAVTPYILKRVNELTEGESLATNIHLVKNNARVASEIAVELSKLKQREKHQGSNSPERNQLETKKQSQKAIYATSHGKPKRQVAVVGGTVVDFYARMKEHDFELNGATYCGSVQQSFGGVGRNLADCLSRLGMNPLFISAIGRDSHKNAFEAYCKHMDLTGVAQLKDQSTATYSAILQESGDLLFGIGDMAIHDSITPEYICQFENDLKDMSLVCVDGNVSIEAIQCVSELCHHHNVPVWFEPTDLHKATKPFKSNTTSQHGVVYTSPNYNELKAIAASLTGENTNISDCCDESDLDSILHNCIKLLPMVCDHIPVVLVTLGKHGVLLCYHDGMTQLPVTGMNIQTGGNIRMEHYPATMPDKKPPSVVSVSGAGDCLAAAMIMAIVKGHDPELCMKTGLLAAQYSLQSGLAVPSYMSEKLFTEEIVKDWMPLKPTLLQSS